jgi:5-methylthioadenosine/S-adenosylhomocysteine deaminase
MVRLRVVVGVACVVVWFGGCREDLPAGSTGTATSGNGANGGSGAEGGGGAGSGGGNGSLVLQGTILTPDTIIEGQIRIEGSVIVCVAAGDVCARESPGAHVVITDGVITPGLIDTHNHILFDVFDGDDWLPSLPPTCAVAIDCESSSYCSGGDCDCVDGHCRYRDHTQWPNEAEYVHMLDYKQCLEDASQGKPPWCPIELDGDGDLKCEMDKWGELKGLVAGTTSIVGLPGTSSACFGSLARSIDVPQNDLESDLVQTSALFPPSATSANGACGNFASGDTDAYLVHAGEGTNANALGELQELFDVTTPDGCLFAPQTAITHGTAFGPPELAQMAAAGMKLTWSPASNVALYGVTTDIPAALAAGLTISLAPDWSMGGSQNLLDEVRFAAAWDDAHFGDVLDARALVEMVTSNAARVLGLDTVLGRLEVGYLADVAVFRAAGDPYESVTGAAAADVRLVLVGGVPLYGDAEFADLGGPACESFDACGTDKFVCVAEADTNDKLDQTLAQIEAALAGGFSTLDAVTPLQPSACTPACGNGDQCFERTSIPIVPASNCPAVCGPGQACFQAAQSGNNQFQCLSINTCYSAKLNALAPVAPLVACP